MKLRALQLPPSYNCTDCMWVRGSVGRSGLLKQCNYHRIEWELIKMNEWRLRHGYPPLVLAEIVPENQA